MRLRFYDLFISQVDATIYTFALEPELSKLLDATSEFHTRPPARGGELSAARKKRASHAAIRRLKIKM